ncbi:MAG: GNAT family N-acetyltransferase [Flavobacteriaceae bacterium]|nr:MAG: GNAT family N-acetyltransferase [Flavobacteriaceae bacterium]
MKTNKFPLLKSSRLILRKTTAIDIDQTYFLRSDAGVNKFIERSEESKTKSLADAASFIQKITQEYDQNKSISWSICMSESSEMIGSICLWNYSDDMKKAELGYSLHPSFQGKGIMSEALQMVVNCGFEYLNFKLIEAYTHCENINSKGLLLKNGFVLNVDKKDAEDPNNEVFDLVKQLR